MATWQQKVEEDFGKPYFSSTDSANGIVRAVSSAMLEHDLCVVTWHHIYAYNLLLSAIILWPLG